MAAQDVISVRMDGQEQSASIADVLEIDMTNIPENEGFFTFPEVLAVWRVKNAEFVTQQMKVAGTQDTAMRMVFVMECEAVNILRAANPQVNKEDLIGSVHRDCITIFDLKEDLGKVLYLLAHAGLATTAPLGQMVEQAIGGYFVAGIKHRKDRNDPDRVHANLDFKTLAPSEGPMQEQHAPAAAPAPAAQAPAAPAQTATQAAPPQAAAPAQATATPALAGLLNKSV